jgi:hypothetical protein
MPVLSGAKISRAVKHKKSIRNMVNLATENGRRNWSSLVFVAGASFHSALKLRAKLGEKGDLAQ